MASEFSFDVVSKVDYNVVDEAISIALKEVINRYDFKGSNSEINFDKKANVIMLQSSDAYKVKALYDVLLMKISKRGLPVKNFEGQKVESALGGTAKQAVKVQQGIPQEKAKEIVRAIKDNKLKANTSIQGDALRVTSKSKDELQSVMTLLRGGDYGITLQFENFR
ncbi:MAG: YajQ family cyclic di-GMP-binding protein [Elusimicrobia bacterium CG_4_10_14_0_2_um_filter_56_8]|nr:MAG: YajQ family cyclic di-GMP-binding protein [Elusimicrobia bacterium CG1_02_56_21]PJA12161.1 MAG: YajQ family cyclic di-GMP-binding protein [Elusimicrobia bacterium CG_4_10_14_0_2_um_filter_56_8]